MLSNKCKILIVLIVFTNCLLCVSTESTKSVNHVKNTKETRQIGVGDKIMESGRTFVHHAVKRLSFILPAVFFKLGVAFTLLILITIVAVNNGLIGFMLLVVGLSTVLARLQEARNKPNNFPIPIPISHYSNNVHPSLGYAHFYDRSDSQQGVKNNVDNTHNLLGYYHNNNNKDVNHPYPYHQSDVVYYNKY